MVETKPQFTRFRHEAVSTALRQAILRTERHRIYGILAVLAILAVVVVVRWLLVPNSALASATHLLLMLAAAYGVYETAMLRIVGRAHRADCDLPVWLLRLNVVIETSAPTAAIFVFVIASAMDPYEVLSAPVVLSYFFFIMLSSLRLKPSQCLLSGLVAAVGYALAVVYIYTTYATSDAGDALGQGIHATRVVMLIIGSLIAAGVASQIRGHMLVSVREAQVRRQMEEELRVARDIQQSLLPRNAPETPDYEVIGWSQPAQETGGDYYDWLTAADGRTLVTLADVTGHGIGPAMITANCHSYVHALFPDETDLAAAMQRLNDLLAADLPDDRFVTFVAATIGPGHEGVQILSAGHGPLLLCRSADGHVEDFNAHAPPLGVMEGIEYPSPQHISLRPGDMLILITDGFFEWMDPDGEEFGIDRLKQSILSAREMPGDQIIQRLHEDVLSFAQGTPQLDDLTAVVIKRLRRKQRVSNCPS